MKQPAFIHGAKVTLRALTMGDLSEAYLGWLNDPEILRYRAPKAFPSTQAGMEQYVMSLGRSNDLVLAICLKADGRHVGNIALTQLLWVHRSAELSILLGDRNLHGQGIGRDAITALTRHAFDNMGLHRLWSESPNPAFNAIMRRLGWVDEGRKRKAFLLEGRYADIECWSLLREDYDAQAGAATT